MKLFFSPTSPFVRKCLVTAHELNLVDRLTFVNCSAHPVNRDQSIIASNPLGKVPTLVTDDGVALYDSRVICEYLNSLGGGTLFPIAGPARWAALAMQSLADGVMDAALLARYETNVRPEAFRWNDWTTGQLDKIATSLGHLEAHPELLTPAVHIGNLTLGCALWYLDLRYADLAWRSKYPHVAQWAAAFMERPSLKGSWSLPA
jgi:glutathione S-transferase